MLNCMNKHSKLSIIKKNLPSIIAIAVPLFLVLAIFLTTYVPKMIVRPKYDFVYSTYGYNDRFGEEFNFSVSNGQILIKEPVDNNNPYSSSYSYYRDTAKALYLYDVENHSSKRLGKSEIELLKIQESVAPDGFQYRDAPERSSLSAISKPYLINGMSKHYLEDMKPYDAEFVGWVVN